MTCHALVIVPKSCSIFVPIVLPLSLCTNFTGATRRVGCRCCRSTAWAPRGGSSSRPSTSPGSGTCTCSPPPATTRTARNCSVCLSGSHVPDPSLMLFCVCLTTTRLHANWNVHKFLDLFSAESVDFWQSVKPWNLQSTSRVFCCCAGASLRNASYLGNPANSGGLTATEKLWTQMFPQEPFHITEFSQVGLQILLLIACLRRFPLG